MHCAMVLLCGLVGVAQAAEPKRPSIPPETAAELIGYITRHRQSPVEYVVKKFETHDIVFIGEFHRIKHDVEFVQSLIPALYEKGVRNLGIEFGRYCDQKLVDRLLSAPAYDEDLARQLMFRNFVGWAYKEYQDLYRAAWKVNRSLGPGQPKFRIVNLAPEIDWSLPKVLLALKFQVTGTADDVMARVVLEEFVAKRQKALVYSGRHHAFTRYREPGTRKARRVGQLVFEKIGDRALMVELHAPWGQRGSGIGRPGDGFERPVGGIIDEVLGRNSVYPVAFDTRGTPFGKLPDRRSYYAEGRDTFVLEDYCDGYIYFKPLEQYEPVTIDDRFITDSNFREAIAQSPNPEARDQVRSASQFMHILRKEVDDVFRHAGMGPQRAPRLKDLQPPPDSQKNDLQPLPDNKKYEQMTPKQAAQAFLEACAKENWDEAEKFRWKPYSKSARESLGGLQVVSLGEPFQRAVSSADWFVPYEIKFKDGGVKKWNLSLRKDPSAKRYIVNGGL